MQNEREDQGNGLPGGDVRPESQTIHREPSPHQANQPTISDDLLFIACAIPILMSTCSAWNQVPGVIAR